eukprot:TRINITY_DN13081_c2_g2_i1.p1 TRINITY_DN13081_c2_g2~~TRINITY_DN13081_c2_g2_i1.p1  ORF type:complete len:267 (+),score=26.44 TRINITY_DN13081_c2_g2_i1:76-876(+)
MKSAGAMSPRSVVPAATERGTRTSPTLSEPAHVRFARGAADVMEFGVETTRTEAIQGGTSPEDTGIGGDSPRVYKMALRERIRIARGQTVPVNEAQALWRAERLRSKLETRDEKHLGVPSKRLARLRKIVATTRVSSQTHEQQPPRSEVDLSWENDDAFVTDVAKGQSATSPVHEFEQEPGGPSHENAKKSKIGAVWRSLTTSCTRAAQFTSKSFSNARRNKFFSGASSKDASHGGTQRLSFTRLQKRGTSRVHSSLASIVPHEEA